VYLVKCDTKEEFLDAKRVVKDYIKWLNLDLTFQNIEYELSNFSKIYHPSSGGVFILVYKDGEVAGGVGLRRISANSCKIKRLFVYKEFRGKNIGYKLIERVIKEAKSMNYKTIKLDTLVSMKKAIKLYKKFGFKEINPYYLSPIKDTIYFKLTL